MSNLRLFTGIWGEDAIGQFERGTLKTLLWPKNKQVLEGSVWDVWTFEEHVEELERLLFNALDIKFEPHIIQKISTPDGKLAAPPFLLRNPMLEQMALCLNSNSKLMMLPPDTLFGDGTLSNLMKLGKDPGTCVVVPHIRTLPHVLHGISSEPLTNPKLCELAFKSLHESWTPAEKGIQPNNSFWSGVSWERLDEKLISVTHRIPTVYLASFTGQDHAFWQAQGSFGAWDHHWPGANLVRQERQRMPGSSDVCMIAEITGPSSNIVMSTPPEISNAGHPADHYWTDTLHSSHNRQSQFIFRFE